MSLTASAQTTRVADQAVFDWIGNLRVDYGRNAFGSDKSDYPIFRVFTVAERSFAEARIILQTQGFIDVLTGAEGEERERQIIAEDELYRQLPRPYARIQRGDPTPTTELHNTPFEDMILSSKGLTFKKGRWPTPYEFGYTIEFISKTQYTANWIREWIMGQFTPVGMGVNQRLIDATYPAPYGVVSLTTFFDGLSDNSDLEVSGGSDRLIRLSLQIRLRVWDMDLVGRDVPAVMGIAREMRTLVGSTLGLRRFGDTLAAVTSGSPSKVYAREPVPDGHLGDFSTAEALTPISGELTPYRFDSDTDFLETTGIPFRTTDAVQGAFVLDWAREDGVDPPPNIRVQIGWRDSDAEYALSVMEEYNVAPTGSPVVVDFQSIPYAVKNEIVFRVLRSTGSPTILVNAVALTVSRSTVANAVQVSDRTKGPNLGTSTDVTASGLTGGAAYIVRGFVNRGTQNVTVTVYGDAGATQVLASKVFTASGEFAFYLRPNNSLLFLIRITVPTADATMTVTGITVTKALPRPLFGA